MIALLVVVTGRDDLMGHPADASVTSDHSQISISGPERPEGPSGRWSAEDLEALANALNNRPRKILNWKTPAEVFDDKLRSLQQSGVASIG